jgi:hypothetical protein
MTNDQIKDELFHLIAESVFGDEHEENYTTPFFFAWPDDKKWVMATSLADIKTQLYFCQTKADIEELVNVEWRNSAFDAYESMQEIVYRPEQPICLTNP